MRIATLLLLAGPLLAAADPQDDLLFEKDVVYGKGGEEELKLNLGRPKDQAGPTPCVVIIHGGGWAAGNKNQHDAQVRDLVKRGYVAATVGYRFAPKHIFPAQIEDVKCAVRFLRANAEKYQIDNLLIWNFSDKPARVELTLQGLPREMLVRRLTLDALAPSDDENARLRPEPRARLARASDDLRFTLVVFRVQHIVRNARALEHACECLRHFHAHRTNQDGEPELVQALRLLEDRVVFLATSLVDEILPVIADHRPVGRNHRNPELVNLVELRLLGLGGTGHSGQLLVEAEVVLNGDGGESLGLAFHLHSFLGLHRLV